MNCSRWRQITEDAYLATGAANYIIGCMPVYKRAVLWVGGIHGDKILGMQQVARAAASGHYLRPYAKLLLALAALREKQPDLARMEFSELTAEFPQNPLFASELAKITPTASAAPPSSMHLSCRGRLCSLRTLLRLQSKNSQAANAETKRAGQES